MRSRACPTCEMTVLGPCGNCGAYGGPGSCPHCDGGVCQTCGIPSREAEAPDDYEHDYDPEDEAEFARSLRPLNVALRAIRNRRH